MAESHFIHLKVADEGLVVGPQKTSDSWNKLHFETI